MKARRRTRALVVSAVLVAACGSTRVDDSADTSAAGSGTGAAAGSQGSEQGGTSGSGKPSGGAAGSPRQDVAGADDGSSLAGAGSGGEGGAALGFEPLNHPVNEYGFAWKDSFFLARCLEQQSALSWCLTVQGACPNQDAVSLEDKGDVFVESFRFGGTLGLVYLVTIRVNGVVEGKYYENGVRRRGSDYSDINEPSGADGWYVGGRPIPSSHDVYKISVFEPDGITEREHYYLNSFPQSSGLESHVTLPIGYEATFEVPGQGLIQHRRQDSNCRAMDNCGAVDQSGGDCVAARNVPNEPGLALPATFGGKTLESMNVVTGAQQPYHAQLVHVTLKQVVLAP